MAARRGDPARHDEAVLAALEALGWRPWPLWVLGGSVVAAMAVGAVLALDAGALAALVLAGAWALGRWSDDRDLAADGLPSSMPVSERRRLAPQLSRALERRAHVAPADAPVPWAVLGDVAHEFRLAGESPSLLILMDLSLATTDLRPELVVRLRVEDTRLRAVPGCPFVGDDGEFRYSVVVLLDRTGWSRRPELELEIPLVFAELPPDRDELRLVAEVDLRAGAEVVRLTELARSFRLPARRGRLGTLAAMVPLDDGEFFSIVSVPPPSNAEVVCPVCGSAESPETLVACSHCEIPQHSDCWEYAGRCSTFGCTGKR